MDGVREILQRLGVRVDERRSNARAISAHCPLAPWTHENGLDKNPSFSVLLGGDRPPAFNCFTCGRHGTLRNLVRLLARYKNADYSGILEKVSDMEADIEIPKWEDFEIREEPGPTVADYNSVSSAFPPVTEFTEALEYLDARRVSPETAEKLELRFDPEQGRVLFPVFGRGREFYGYTGRAVNPETKPKIRDYSGLSKRHVVMGADRWREGKPLFLVEGLFAFARLHELGFDGPANIGALLGCVLTPEKSQLVADFGESVFLLLDNDSAGEKGIFGRGGAIDRLYPHVPLFIPAYPEGKSDPDELTRAELDEILKETDLYLLDKK